MIMKKTTANSILFVFAAIVISSCSADDRVDASFDALQTETIFNISISENTRTRTRSNTKSDVDSRTSYNTEKKKAYLDPDIACCLVGIDHESMDVLVDNQPISETKGVRSANIVTSYLSSRIMTVSAFYPYTSAVSYHKDYSYIVSFSADDVKKGPLASNYVEMRCDETHETVNLNFHHITNSIGFKVCDITGDDQLKGLMHIRKVVIHGMPTEGTFVVDGNSSFWVPSPKRQDIVLFEGDDFVEYGEDHELYISENGLTLTKEDCHRVYVVPEVLTEHHYVEVVFDIDAFDYDGTRYRASEGKTQIIPLSGVIPDDTFELGLQYTFVLGMNVGAIYRPIEFTASIDEWEAKYGSHIIDYDNE